jgi:UDP-MurNAc hydroxylase
MKFTILSHAGLLVEHRGTSLVIDPWLVGSCYWRSWWNFPEPPAAILEGLKPDYIYLTHLHWDHFHGVSLKRFSPKTPILVPKACTDRMVRDLAWLGFHDVREIDHGDHVDLGPDFRLHSFQFGLGVDSAAILEGGGTTLFDCNDCKLFGLPLQQITDRFPKIDFVLRSHSSASALPYCIEDYERSFSGMRSAEDYGEEFSRFALLIKAKYAVPFASNHCFLHKDTLRFNRTAAVPAAVSARCNALAAEQHLPTECVVMAPGSKWSDEEGFSIVPFDYEKRGEYVEMLRERYRDKLEAYYAEEEAEHADFEAFSAYFQGFLAAVPAPVRRWMLGRIVFSTTDPDGPHHFLVDGPGKRVERLAAAPTGEIVIEVPTKVLNDCAKIQMFSVWTASKRLKVKLPEPGMVKRVSLLFSLLDAYELSMLPLSMNLRPRSLGVYARRWREAVEAARLLVKHKVLGKPLDYGKLYPLPSEAHA